ncbi:MAG: sugar hydrolase, partial [Streptomyces sp.]|nr:sugar hydrolase [Streptomyces sp.]
MRHQLPAAAGAVTLLGALLTLGTPSTANAAVPATIPLKVTNNSGRGDAVYIYNLGT